jgi:hypothetical protein
MKHMIDWQNAELRFTYQYRQCTQRGSIQLPSEVVAQLSRKYGRFRDFPTLYCIETDLSWDPCHPLFGSFMKRGIRVAGEHDTSFTIELYVEPHGPMILTIRLLPPAPPRRNSKGTASHARTPSSSKIRPEQFAVPAAPPSLRGRERTAADNAGTAASGEKVYVSAAQLLDRGWTRTMIDRFLGPHDTIESAGHFLNFSGKAMWLLQRVEAAEAAPDFKEYMSRLTARRNARMHGKGQ